MPGFVKNADTNYQLFNKLIEKHEDKKASKKTSLKDKNEGTSLSARIECLI
jgi:hypothetical protein